MKRKVYVAFLCMLLVICCTLSSLAAVDYTLPEKLSKQLSVGSGLKGKFTITAEGNDPFVLALVPFLDTELQLRGLTFEGESHYYVYQDAGDEIQRGLTEFYVKNDQLYIRSDMVPGQILCLPEAGKLLDMLTKSEGENPAFASFLMNINRQGKAGAESTWEPMVERLTKKMELWIARFEVASVEQTAENGTVSELNYTIPMAELKKEILVLLKEIRQDGDLMTALKNVMTEEQQEIYLADNLDYFFTEALNSLKDDFDVVISRKVSALGEDLSSSIELPLDRDRFGGYDSLNITSSGKTLTIILKNENQIVHLVTDDGLFPEKKDNRTWWYMTYPNTEMDSSSRIRSALKINFSSSSEISVDEDEKSHQNDRYVLTAERDVSRLPEEEDGSAYPEQVPFRCEVTLHYSSKYAQSSPTSLEINAALDMENIRLNISGTLKSASPWIFSPFDTTGARNLMEMTTEEKNLLLAEFLAGASEQLIRLSPEEERTAGPETEAAAGPAEASDTEAGGNQEVEPMPANDGTNEGESNI